jgi:uncharacterized membrane protein YkvA (DUF1232 family)
VYKIIRRLRFIFNVKKFLPFLIDFFRSKEVAPSKKILSVVFLIAYIVFPFDLIPDVLTFFGFLDDLAIFMFIMERIIKISPVDLKNKHGFK